MSFNPFQRSPHGESSHHTPAPGNILPPGSQNTPFDDKTTNQHRAPPKSIRRIRGEIACAECRRLKIRCDKTVPCSTCVKRGCGALCPNGTIPPGDGSRFVMAAADHLRHKLVRMEARMRSLEDAIAIIDHPPAGQMHPLLSAIDNADEDGEPTTEDAEEPLDSSSLADALGTLYLDGEGGSRFFGPSGGSESLLLQKSQQMEGQHLDVRTQPHLQELDPSYLPPEINHCYQSFPFTPPGINNADVQNAIASCLPPMNRAITLCDTFLEHLSWMFSIVSRHHLVQELIPIIYTQNEPRYGPHDLALLLVVLGIGCLVDLDLAPYNLEAQHYYRLARATVSLQPVLAQQSVVTIKVLHLMSVYNGLSGKESNLEQSYVLLDLAAQVATRIGFHPSLWGFEGREAYDRRVYFWNLMAGVLWQSLATGRPPGLLTSYIDCKIPSAEEEDLYQQGEVPLGFGIWGYKASVECLIPLAKTVLAAKPPTYNTILELDSKIRNLALPEPDNIPNQTERTAISMQTFVRSHYQELMLMFLHRGYFAQAMAEKGRTPLDSRYSQSVLAAYSSACTVLQDTRVQFAKKPLLCARVWRIWTFTFSAAVIVATMAIRGYHLNFRPPPLEELEAICGVFEKAAEISSRAARASPILQVMLQKALQARDAFYRSGTVASAEAQGDDELSLFGGKTRVINTEAFSLGTDNPACHSNEPAKMQVTEQSAVPHYPPNYSTSECAMHTSISDAQRFSETYSAKFPNTSVHLTEHARPITASTQHMQSGPSTSRVEDYGHFTTIADLSGGWDGLFHEIPNPSFREAQSVHLTYRQPPGENAMLNDRWSSIMHTHGILGDPTLHRERPQ